MSKRLNDKISDKDFVESSLDDFPPTDKMPLREEIGNGLEVEDLNQDTIPDTLFAEFEESRINAELISFQQKKKEGKPESIWNSDFTDSIRDLKDGSTVEEIDPSEDLFKKYFDK